MPAPSVTVLMACFNGERWLREAVASVLDQTLKDFEFLIIDDGSVDGSSAILAEFARNDGRVRVLTKTNTGLADSLNVGMAAAKGKWLARRGADDVCEPDRLERQLNHVNENPGIVFLGSGLIEIDEFGRIVTRHHYPTDHASLTKALTHRHKFPPHSSAFFDKAVVISLGGYRPRIRCAEDYDLWLRLSEVGKVASLDRALVRIRQHPEQISQGATGIQQQIDARIALVGYWLRKRGAIDPISGSDDVFMRFSHFVSQRVISSHVIEYAQYVRRVRVIMLSRNASLNFRLGAVSAALSNRRFLLTFFWMWIFPEKLSARIADQWSLTSPTSA